MSDEKLIHSDITEKVLKAFYHVYNSLGEGFLQKVYENAMVVALKKLGVDAVQQMPIVVYFESEPVGEYFADLLVGGNVVVELKAPSVAGEGARSAAYQLSESNPVRSRPVT